jgi:transcriptional regulator with XRE-family HTH domain
MSRAVESPHPIGGEGKKLGRWLLDRELPETCRAFVVVAVQPLGDDGRSKEKTMSNVESGTRQRKFTPAEMAAIVKLFRDDRGWSQEVLADLSGIDVRTVQRLEGGEGVGAITLRAIARAFGYGDIDFFNKPHTIPTQEDVEATQKRFHEENLLLDAVVATTGHDLGGAFVQCTMDASSPAIELTATAAQEFAHLIDYLRDVRDIADLANEVQKLEYFNEVGEMLMRLHAEDVDVCYAIRDTKITGGDWADKTPWALKIMYCSVFTRGKVPGKMAVPKKLELGW